MLLERTKALVANQTGEALIKATAETLRNHSGGGGSISSLNNTHSNSNTSLINSVDGKSQGLVITYIYPLISDIECLPLPPPPGRNTAIIITIK